MHSRGDGLSLCRESLLQGIQPGALKLAWGHAFLGLSRRPAWWSAEQEMSETACSLEMLLELVPPDLTVSSFAKNPTWQVSPPRFVHAGPT